MSDIDSWVIQNYEEIVADENRNVSWEQVAENAERLDDVALAAYARQRAAEADVNITPVAAVPEPKAVREK